MSTILAFLVHGAMARLMASTGCRYNDENLDQVKCRTFAPGEFEPPPGDTDGDYLATRRS
jgi:hypothetical protein